MKVKVLTADEAAKMVPNNINFATCGFIGAGFPEELACSIEKRFLTEGAPNHLTMLFCAAQGDFKEKGLNHFGHEGMISRAIGSHWGLAPKVGNLAIDNLIEAYNIPQGVMNQLFRDSAAKKPGVLTQIGLETYIDPRNGGGKINDLSNENFIKLIEIDKKEYLLYKTLPVDFAIIGGSYADTNGNISLEKCGIKGEALAIAQACKNSGGKVIVQVEAVVKEGMLDPQKVEIPGILVDAVVVASKPEYHMQTFATQYNPGISGEHRVSEDSVQDLKMNAKKIVARRALMELKKGSIINLGIGIPEFIAVVAKEESCGNDFTLTVESGIVGGKPLGGLDFGVSLNPDCIMPQPSMFDFYQGGGLDQAFLGFAQSDYSGNVNVSKFENHFPGCGGFIDISQSSKEIIFCGTFTAGGLMIKTDETGLVILNEGKISKWVDAVEQKTFSGKLALKNNIPIKFITERAVFKLTNEGLLLTEIAPGIDIEHDIFKQMPKKPLVSNDLKLMATRIFSERKMGISK